MVVDLRNHYECEVGRFENAILPEANTFREALPEVLESLKGSEDKKLLLYCTGGIRCEKASAWFKFNGFSDVNQLHGGIIDYARQVKEEGLPSLYRGKNFVFDKRLSEAITDDVLAQCHQCDNPWDLHSNCRFEGCNRLFLQCASCKEEFDACCSKTCQEIMQKPKEVRVALQYLFQAFNHRGPRKYRDMLMETGTEELAHIEMLCTAVSLNLRDAPVELKEPMETHPIIGMKMAGMSPRQILSAGLGALCADAEGVPFNGSWVTSSGNIAADMTANVMAESTGRTLATRLYEMTDDPGMKDMLAFLIARDTMHQNQWMAVLQELGNPFPIPNSFPQAKENQDVNYTFVSTWRDPKMQAPAGRWCQGRSIDGHGEFGVKRIEQNGHVPAPDLGLPRPELHAQIEQQTPAGSVK
ncbi:MAG: rhodanese-related sulfurtransferase [Verrucomicrobiaceae bacterium]|nr:MAG: rhodanese-related sulfurtransferase [Verrucomicrobiaceae bacterium]